MKLLLLAPCIVGLIALVITEAHPISSEEIAIRLVINQFDNHLRKRPEGTGLNPAYMAWVKDDCKVIIKAWIHQPRTFSATEWFDVDVCKGQVKLIDLTKR